MRSTCICQSPSVARGRTRSCSCRRGPMTLIWCKSLIQTRPSVHGVLLCMQLTDCTTAFVICITLCVVWTQLFVNILMKAGGPRRVESTFNCICVSLLSSFLSRTYCIARGRLHGHGSSDFCHFLIQYLFQVQLSPVECHTCP